jgi:AcrR family transcriptional regulator
VLAAARDAFSVAGFSGTTVRHIAAAAGVDPALIHHYFGSKRALFLEAVQAPADPQVALRPVFDGGRDEAGRRLATVFLALWDGPGRTQGTALLRSAVSDESAAALLREFLLTQVLLPVLEHVGVEPAERPLRAGLLASQLGGLALTRYVLAVPPLVAAPASAIVAAVAPTLQHYLTGDLSTGLIALRPGVPAQPSPSAPPGWNSGPGL